MLIRSFEKDSDEKIIKSQVIAEQGVTRPCNPIVFVTPVNQCIDY